MQGSSVTFMGAKSEHQIAITKDILERLNSILRETELFLQEERVGHDNFTNTNKANLMEFFQSQDPQITHPELYQRIIDKIIKQRKGWHALEAKPEAIFQVVKQYANEVFYDSDSIYQSQTFLGNGSSPSKINEYYLKLLNKNILDNPFNWTYLNQADFNFQGTGTSMLGRNMKDFKTILDVTSYFMSLNKSVNDAISQPDKSVETIEKAFDNLGEKLWEVKGSHGHLSSEMGWLMSAYTLYPFIPSRVRDLPIVGALSARLINTWGGFFNNSDMWKGLVWDSAKRKKVVDKWLHSPISKHILSPLQDNKQVEPILRDEIPLFKLPFKDKNNEQVQIKIPLPGPLKKWFGKVTKPYLESDFTVDNFKKFSRLESWWVGGKENLGLGYNTLLTILTIGFLMMMFQAVKEGMKEVEIK